MASSGSTQNLKLNQWEGGDKPKMADFNADNLKIDQAVGAHLTDPAAHPVLQAVSGTYTGDGGRFQVINLGFTPKYGFLFAVDLAPTVTEVGSSGNMQMYSAFFGPGGCTPGIMLEDGQSGFGEETDRGIVVMNSSASVGYAISKLNEENQIYTYVVWR